MLRLLLASSLIFASALAVFAGERSVTANGDGKPSLIKDGSQPRIMGLWLMGQSLCEGSQSLPIVTSKDPGHGNYAFRRGVRTWILGDHSADPEHRSNDQFAFVPLTAAVYGGLGETIANGLADHLRETLLKPDQASVRGEAPHFLVAYAGQGGRTIEELSAADESTDSRTPPVKQNGGGFYKTSLDDARRAKEQARARGEVFEIAALIWMQGEANGGSQGGIVPSRWKPELPRPEGQEWYRDCLIAYRQQWSDELRAITDQAGEIPMFTYQTLGPAGEAQLMAVDCDPNLRMVGPHYMVPSALDSRTAAGYGAAIHLSADGQRWYGEQVAKVVRRVLVEGESWQPLRPRIARIDPSRSSVLVDFLVPRPPLVIDDHFLAQEQSEISGGFSSLCGFQIRNAAGAVVALTAVEVESPTSIRIKLTSPLPRGVEYTLSYGQSFAGKIGTIASIQNGPASGDQSTTELLIPGTLPDGLKPMLAEGAFYAANTLSGDAFAMAPIRWVREENGSTVLRFENRERRNNEDFAAGQTLMALRPFSYGNLRDSDAEPATYRFTDTAYGTRAGEPYPLWNWCVQFSRFPISEM